MKLAVLLGIFTPFIVAPCAGAWIETMALLLPSSSELVAPCAGAWIETGVGRG